MSTSEAVRAFLELVGRGNPQGPREMATALVASGRDSDEAKAYTNVTSVLKRMKRPRRSNRSVAVSGSYRSGAAGPPLRGNQRAGGTVRPKET